jgi:sulfatase modifying factor 1
VTQWAPDGTEVGVLTAIDSDAGDTHTFSFYGGSSYPDNSSFRIEGNRLLTSGLPTGTEYELSIRVQDLGGETFYAEITISVIPRVPVSSNTAVLGEDFSVFAAADVEMLWVEPGTFTMGSPASEPNRLSDETQHEVTLTQGYWLAKHELTQAQWKAVMGTDPSKFKGDNLPVERVNWEEAKAFCDKLQEQESAAGRVPAGYAYRLPTEAQWEYACRAGTTTATAFGNSLSSTQANFDGTSPYNGGATWRSLNKTANVGSYAANAWGFHDMHGNVFEWCADWYGNYPFGSVADPAGASSGTLRGTRGGCWLRNGMYCRSAFRFRAHPGAQALPPGLPPQSPV